MGEDRQTKSASRYLHDHSPPNMVPLQSSLYFCLFVCLFVYYYLFYFIFFFFQHFPSSRSILIQSKYPSSLLIYCCCPCLLFCESVACYSSGGRIKGYRMPYAILLKWDNTQTINNIYSTRLLVKGR